MDGVSTVSKKLNNIPPSRFNSCTLCTKLFVYHLKNCCMQQTGTNCARMHVRSRRLNPFPTRCDHSIKSELENGQNKNLPEPALSLLFFLITDTRSIDGASCTPPCVFIYLFSIFQKHNCHLNYLAGWSLFSSSDFNLIKSPFWRRKVLFFASTI